MYHCVFSAGTDLGGLIEKLAWNSHEVWSKDRITQGWTYGAKRDDRKKMHPSLVAYEKLSDDDKQWDRSTAAQTLKVIRALGYVIAKGPAPKREVLNRATTRLAIMTKGLGGSSAQSTAGERPGSASGARPAEADDPTGLAKTVSPTGIAPTPMAGGTHDEKSMQSASSAAELLPRSKSGAMLLDAAKRSQSTFPETEVVDDVAISPRDGSAPDFEQGDDAALPADGEEDEYVPKPIDTSAIKLSKELASLVELLSKNMHEVWAEGKIKAGWRYAPSTANGKEADKTSNMMVPYEFLTDNEKAMSRNSAVEMVKAMIFFGYRFELEAGRTAVDPSELTKKISNEEMDAMQRKKTEVMQFKLGVFNALLFCVARRGQDKMLDPLLLTEPPLAQINCVDEFGRSPLYWSVQRGHFKTCKALVDLSANLELTDGNKVGTLSIAAHAGDLRICKLLLDHGAQYTQRDCLGLTPLHYAAFGGHDPVVALLAKKLTLHARGVTVDFDLPDDMPEGAASPTTVFTALSNTFRKSISDRKALKDAPESQADKKQKWQDATSKLVLLNRSTKILASPGTPKSGAESPGSMSSRNLLRAFSGKRWSIASAGLSRSARIAIPAVHLQPRDISACNDLTHVVLANVQTSSNAERESQERALAVASATQGMGTSTPTKVTNRAPDAGARPTTAMRGALKAEVPLVTADFINVADSSSLRTPSAIDVLTLRSETKSEHTLVGGTHPPMPLEPPRTISASHILISSQLAVVDPGRAATVTADVYGEDRIVPQAHELFPLPAAVLGLPIPPLRPAAPPAPPRLPGPSEAVGDLLSTNSKVPHLSPLSLAVHSRQYNVAKLLLKFGGDATKKDGSQMSPYDRALAQHAVAVRVCELLNRSTFTAGEGEQEEPAAGTDSSPAPDNRREAFQGGVKKVLRADSAAKVTSNLYHHQLKEQLARGRRPSKLLSQNTTEIDADDNDALFGMQDEETDGKKKPWQLIRRLSKQPGGLPAALQAAQGGSKIRPNASAIKLAVGSGGSAEDFGTSKPVRKSAFQAGRGSMDHPETRELSKRDQAERDRQEAAKERARELAVRAAKREEKSTATMVSVLNTSKTVQSKRKYFALWTLFQETATFLALVLLFAFMTPTSPDYNGNAQSMFNQALQNTFKGPFTSSVSDKASWLQFVDKHILWIPDSNITTGGPLQGSYITPVAARRLKDMAPTPFLLDPPSSRSLRGQSHPESSIFAPAPAHLSRYTYAHGVLHKSLDGIDGSFPSNYQQRRMQSSVDAPIAPSADEVNVIAVGDPSTAASAFQPSPDATSMGNASFVAPMTVANSVVVGAIRVRRTRLPIVACDIPSEIANVPREVCLAEETYSPPYDYVQAGPSITNQDLLTADNDYGDLFDLDCADVLRRRALVDAHREQTADSWVSDEVNSLSIEFVLYNPSFNIFGAVRLFVHFPDFGGVYTTVISRCVKLYNGRFQPSLIFEGVLVGQVMLQAALLYRQARRAGLRKWLRNGWNVYEVLTWALFLGILLFDIASLMAVRRLHLDLNQHSQFYDVWSTAGLLRSEVDLISVLFYLIIFRFIKYARLIPGWGPILLSIIMTIQDVSVILYTAVMIGLTLAFSIAHHVAMGTESAYFSSIVVSFEQLFAMSTAQQFQIFNEATPRTITTIYFLLWSVPLPFASLQESLVCHQSALCAGRSSRCFC
jgi:ankyrin repeat protein